MIIGHGMVAFRDPHGIRPLVLGKRDVGDGRTEYMVASESVALDTLGFEFLRDVAPGEAIYITEKGQLFTRQCSDNPVSNPCLFEYVYFARPDSFIDKISVYSARVNMGTKLGEKIAREWEDLDIDVVILSRKPPAISHWKLPVFSASRTARICQKSLRGTYLYHAGPTATP